MTATKTHVCRWTYDKNHCAWDTECDNKHLFEADGPRENRHWFCPYCGGRLRVLAKEQKRFERLERLENWA